VATTVNLPAGAAGKSIALRWRFAMDKRTVGTWAGWRIDSISVFN